MTKEFNLSEEIWEIDNDNVVHTDDIKEFIRLLKEEIENAEQSGYINDEQIDLREIIDKLSGKELI